MSSFEKVMGQRIVLRRAGQEHASFLYRECWSDPVVMRYQDFPILRNDFEAVSRLEESGEAWDAGDEFSWVVHRLTHERENPVGIVVLSKNADNRYSLGYAIGKLFWGQGFATESVRLLLELAFWQLDAAVVLGECSRSNRASARVLEKLGFERTQAFVNEHTLCNLHASIVRVVDRYALERNAFCFTK